jgi:MYND finger
MMEASWPLVVTGAWLERSCPTGVMLRTRHGGRPFKIAFYHDREPTNGFSFDQLRPGNTLAILYAERKTYMDGTDGVRQEDLDAVWVFKAPLAIVQEEVKKLLALADAGEGDVEHICFGCGEADTSEKRHDKCARCRHARYCSRECQVKHWGDAHKGLCKDSEKLLRLSCLDRHPFKKRGWFSMESLPPHRKR